MQKTKERLQLSPLANVASKFLSIKSQIDRLLATGRKRNLKWKKHNCLAISKR